MAYEPFYENGFVNAGEGQTPVSAEFLNRLEGFLASMPVMEHGATELTTVAGGTCEVMNIRFGQNFPAVPHVLVCFQSGSTSANFGLATVFSDNVTTTGFRIKISNAHTNPFTPRVVWLAIA